MRKLPLILIIGAIFTVFFPGNGAELTSRTISKGTTVNVYDNQISTAGNVAVDSGGTLNLVGNSIKLTSGFLVRAGAKFAVNGKWDGIQPIPNNINEFVQFEIFDTRKEANCRNFSDGGALYSFKIINGKVFYSRDGVFKGEFSLSSNKSSAVFKDYISSRAGYEYSAPSFTMIAADNNRVIVKDSAMNLYWASLVLEYTNDYHDYTADESPRKSVPGSYCKVDPDEGISQLGNPYFSGDPNTHFATSGYVDTTKLTIPDVNLPGLVKLKLSSKVLYSKRPVLSTVTTTVYEATPQLNETGPILPDLMQVVVDSCRWYKIDARPPRNSTEAPLEQGNAGYTERKKAIFRELSGYMVKIGRKLLSTPDPVTGETDGQKIMSEVRAEMQSYAKDQNMPSKDLITGAEIGGCIALPFICSWLVDYLEKAKEVYEIIDKIDTATVIHVMYSVEKFYNINIDTALSRGYDSVTFSNSLDTLRGELYNTFTKGTSLEGSLKATFEDLSNSAAARIASGLGVLNLSFVLPNTLSYLPRGTTTEWKVIADGLRSWNAYFKYPGDKFIMQNNYPYKNSTNSADCKTTIQIDSIIDIGVGNISRYEHMRMHNGGELGAFFGKTDMPEAWDPQFANGQIESPLESIDGHGFVDGTTNFFMLAAIKMRDTPADNFRPAYAVLWIDEQEYFSERWRVLHPRDNAFEGLAGTMSSAFPVLSWFNRYDMGYLEERYWTPYTVLKANARMANSRYATVIAGDDAIYSNSFFWAITDQTWRWRNYPPVDSSIGESIDKKSIGIREDQTIYLKGRKVLGGKAIDGYFYQRCLGPDNTQKGAPTSYNQIPQKPIFPYTHDWNFISTDAFNAANTYYRMGMYETNGGMDPDLFSYIRRDYMPHKYKGYNPRTHIFKIKPGTQFNKIADLLRPPGTLKVLVQNEWTLEIDSLWEENNVIRKKAIPLTHPMYKQMAQKYRSPIRFVRYNDKILFSDPKNDDIKILTKPYVLIDQSTSTSQEVKQGSQAWAAPTTVTRPAQFDSVITDSSVVKTKKIDVVNTFSIDGLGKPIIKNPGFGMYIKISKTTTTTTTSRAYYPFVYYDDYYRAARFRINIKNLADLNVWAELPVDTVTVTHNGTNNTITCSFRLPNKGMNQYELQSIKIGLIKDTAATIFKTIPVSAGETTQIVTTSPISVTAAEWNDYFTDMGRAKCGTSIWVQDAFGNGNVFSCMVIK